MTFIVFAQIKEAPTYIIGPLICGCVKIFYLKFHKVINAVELGHKFSIEEKARLDKSY